MMNRRTFGLGAISLALPHGAYAAQGVLGPPTALGIPSRAYVQRPAVVRQQCAEWCWAASASMVFAASGHPIDQRKIVAAVFNAVICSSSPSLAIDQVLSAQWVDDNGQSFQSTVTAAYDVVNGILAIDNSIIINELAQDRPLLYANTHHAMVVAQVDYFLNNMGPNVRAVGVLDPWPSNPAFHPLSGAEMLPAHQGGQMTYLASVNVT